MNNELNAPEGQKGFEALALQFLESLKRVVSTSQNAEQSVPISFQGATFNFVMNGTISRCGTAQSAYRHEDNVTPSKGVSDETVARALSIINGKDNVLNNYQLWLGACCLLMWKYGFPHSLELCCKRIGELPFGDNPLELDCKYESIRKLAYLKFVNTDVDNWGSYKPAEDEKKLFYGCYAVVQELDKAIQLVKNEI